MPMIVAPLPSACSDRIGGRQRLMGAGLALQAVGLAWIAAVTTPTTPYGDLVFPFIISGIGMALFFAPVANVVLSAVRSEEEGQASGANNAIRELGGVFGVGGSRCSVRALRGYRSGHTFVNGMVPSVYIGAIVVALGSVAAFSIRHSRRVESPRPTGRVRPGWFRPRKLGRPEVRTRLGSRDERVCREDDLPVAFALPKILDNRYFNSVERACDSGRDATDETDAGGACRGKVSQRVANEEQVTSREPGLVENPAQNLGLLRRTAKDAAKCPAELTSAHDLS